MTKSNKNKAPYAIKGFCPVEPVPKGRPKFSFRNGKRMTRTPEKTVRYESAVRTHFMEKYGLTTPPMDGPLIVRLEFVMPRPKNTPKKTFYKDTKPDTDNLVKSFLDSLDFKSKGDDGKARGVIANDSRVVILEAAKRYTRKGETSGTRYSIQTIDSLIVVLDDSLDRSVANVLMPDIPALMLSQVKELAVENAEGAYGSAAGASGAASKNEPAGTAVRDVYLFLPAGAGNHDEAMDIVRTAFPNARNIWSN